MTDDGIIDLVTITEIAPIPAPTPPRRHLFARWSLDELREREAAITPFEELEARTGRDKTRVGGVLRACDDILDDFARRVTAGTSEPRDRDEVYHRRLLALCQLWVNMRASLESKETGLRSLELRPVAAGEPQAAIYAMQRLQEDRRLALFGTPRSAAYQQELTR